jgi:hypothetical protein
VSTVPYLRGFTFSDRKTSPDEPLNVFVPFTTERETVAALRRATSLSRDLKARIEMIVPEVVPYPLPLDRPPVVLWILEDRYRLILEHSGVDAGIQIYLCREPREAIGGALKPRSLVVVGARRRIWPTRESHLCTWLGSQGHCVVVVHPGEDNCSLSQETPERL